MVKSVIKIILIVFTVVFFSELEASENIRAIKQYSNSYIEVELIVPLERDGQLFDSLEVGLYKDKKLIIYTEVKGELIDDEVFHLLRISKEMMTEVNLSVTYGDGLLCDNTVLNYKLVDLFSE